MFSRSCHRALPSSNLFPAFHCHISPTTRFSRRLPLTRNPWPRPRPITTRAAVKKLFKENPFTAPLAALSILIGVGLVINTNYIYYTYIIGEFKAYPEPVAVKLRRAVYYHNIDLQPNNALKYYRQALEVAEQIGMDPFSDEILGVKIRVAFMMEKTQDYDRAINVLEMVFSDCLRWIEKLGDKPGNEGKRTRVLGKTVALSVKLAELYSSNLIDNIEAAEEKLTYSVVAVLKEKKRREEEGVKDGEGEWITDEEIGASMEALGTHYEARDHHYLAAPLFLQALTMLPASHCHSVVLMNNLSISLLLQTPPSSPSSPPPPPPPPPLYADAELWAQKAISLAQSIGPPQRTRDCDEGCAVAMVNMGEFRRRVGDLGVAEDWFRRARDLSAEVGFGDGVRRAEEGLGGLGVGVGVGGEDV